MKKDSSHPLRPRRMGVAEAKARLSEVLRGLEQGPVVIHSRGRDVGVLVDVQTFSRIEGDPGPRSGGAAFLARVAALKRRHGGGVEGFLPAKAAITPVEPFAVRRR